MPLYIGDYLGDTGHLSTVHHGAYLLLMMHYWRQGYLPEDDKQLAIITKLSLRAWMDCRATLQAFFYDGWKHKRIDAELSKMERATLRRSAAGQKGGLRAAMNRMLLEDGVKRSNATAKLRQPPATGTLDHSHSHIDKTTTVCVERGKGLAEGESAKPPHQATRTELEATFVKRRGLQS